MLYRQKISPSAEIQLPSEIKHMDYTGRFHRGALQESAPINMCLLSRFPCRFEIQDWTDAAKRNLEKGRKKEESSEARMNRFFFFVPWPGGRLLELGDESRRRPLIYCTVHCCRRWIAPDSLSLSLSYFLCFSPPCP